MLLPLAALIVATATAQQRPAPERPAPISARDSSALEALLARLADTSAVTVASVNTALRHRASVYVPVLERWRRERQGARKYDAAVALGRSGPEAYEVLRGFVRQGLHSMTDSRTMDRDIAMMAIATNDEFLAVLEPLLTSRGLGDRSAGIDALAFRGGDLTMFGPALVAAFEDSSSYISGRAMLALYIPDRFIATDALRHRYVARLIELMESSDGRSGRDALWTLARLRPEGTVAIPRLTQLAESDAAFELRESAIAHLMRLTSDTATLVPLLVRRLDDPDPKMRRFARGSIRTLGARKLPPELAVMAVERVEPFITAADEGVHYDAIWTLLALGTPARDAFARALTHRNPGIRFYAVQGLSQLRDDPWVDGSLLETLSDAYQGVSTAAGMALVGSGRRVEGKLTELANNDPARSQGARWVLALIRSMRAAGVADRCYAVSYGAWQPSIPPDREQLITAPSRVRFRTTLSGELNRALFAVDQEIRGKWTTGVGWRPDTTAGSLSLDGSRMSTGVDMRLRAEADGSLSGDARTDTGGPRPEGYAWAVRLVRTDCKVDFTPTVP